MTDEATPTGGAEPAPAAPSTEKATGVSRLKAILGGKPDPAKAAPAPDSDAAPVEGKPIAAEATEPVDSAPTEPAEESTEQAAAPQPPDLAAVAKMLGVSPAELVIDEDGTLAFKTKVDGIEGKAKPTDLRKSFQLEAAHTRRLMELSEREKAFQAEAQQRAAAIQAEAKQLDEYLAVAQSELYRDYNGTDWAALKATDPVEFNSKWIDLQQRQAALNQALEGRRAEQTKAQAEAEKREEARLASEYRELLNHNPEWSDEGTRKGFVSFLKDSYGMTDEQVAWVAKSSATGIRIVLDAQKWHKAQADAKKAKAEVLKKVEAAPKMAKAGAAASQDNEARKVQQLRTAIKKGSKTAGPEFLKRTVLAKFNKQRG